MSRRTERMRVFVVSLERSRDRRAAVTAALARAGIEFEIFDAVDGSAPGFAYSDRAAPDVTRARKGWALTNGQLACFASHLSLWQRCVELGEPIAVLEDDVEPSTDAARVLGSTFAHAERFGFVKLARLRNARFKAALALGDGHFIGRYRRNTCGTQAYIVAPAAARAFVTNAERFLEPVDDYMEKPWLHGVRTYSVRPSLFEHLDGETAMTEQRRLKPDRRALDRFRAWRFRAREKFLRLVAG